MRSIALPVLFVAIALACKPDGASTDPSTATAAPSSESDGSSAPAAGATDAHGEAEPEQVGDATLLLLDIGHEPRELLRLQPKPGSTEIVTIRMEMAMRQGLLDQDPPMVRIPATSMQVALRIQSVADGKIVCETETRGYTVEDDGRFPPAALEKMRSELAGIEGMRGHYVMTDRGVAEEVELDVPSTASPRMQQTMQQTTEAIRQLSFPLPAEPLGAGARWSVTDQVDSAGLQLEQTATYLLRSCKGGRCTFDVEVSQRLLDDDFSPPGLPNGVSAKVSEFNSSGDGRYEHDFRHISPIVSSVGVSMRSVFDLSADGVTARMRMDLDVQTDFGLEQ